MTHPAPHAPPPPPSRWVVSRAHPSKSIALDRPRLLAILNLTPDSFSDGGDVPTPDAALRAAERCVTEGADALDLGGESTRPGAAAISAREQISRVVPSLREIRRVLGDSIPITIDTMSAEVAAAALDAGADAINDVSGATADPAMLPLVAARGAGVILMHRLRPPAQDSYSHAYAVEPDYAPHGVVYAVRSALADRADAALAAGIPREQIILDPGLGFGKTVAQNMALIDATPELAALGFPVLSALSRKSFTARVGNLDPSVPPRDRLAPTLALSIVHLLRGCRLFRVHDVAAHAQGLTAAWAVVGSGGSGAGYRVSGIG